MKNIKRLSLLFIVLLLSGCVSHVSEEYFRPSAVPEKVIIREPSGSDGMNIANPWEACRIPGNKSSKVSMLNEIGNKELQLRAAIRLEIQPTEAESTIIAQRCMNGGLYVCNATMYVQCMDPVDFNSEANEDMVMICSDPELEGVTLPPAVVGRNSAYEWQCKDGEPVITSQVLFGDTDGYNENIWLEIPAE